MKLKLQVDLTRKKILAAAGTLAVMWYLSDLPNKPLIYTGTVEGKKARVEVYRDRTIVDVTNNEGFRLIGIDFNSDGIYEAMKFEKEGKTGDLGDYLLNRGSDAATINSLTSAAAKSLNFARGRLLGGN